MLRCGIRGSVAAPHWSLTLLNLLYAVLLGGVAVQLSAFATSMYLHRCLAHRGLYLHPLAAFPLRLHLWLMTGIVPQQWVAVHRKHHRFTDQEGDPHSPVLKGLWPVLLWNAIYYTREARDPASRRSPPASGCRSITSAA